jgi:hypothetical protein|nr:MAG TPA: hypothetical protein [Caudoviricetes sp.]
MRVEIGYTYTKGGGFTLGRVFSAEEPPAWIMNVFPKFIPAKDVSDIDNAIDKVVAESKRIDECNTFHSWLLRRDIPLFTTVTLQVH